MWWNERRPEIIEDFEREVLGRVPPNAPRITWTITKTVNDYVGHILSSPKNSQDTPTTAPARESASISSWLWLRRPGVRKPVPLMLMFGRAALPSAPVPEAFARMAALAEPIARSPATHRRRMGYALLIPEVCKPITARDSPVGSSAWRIRTASQPEDWGALRAWAWGASRALDHLEVDPAVDAKHVGIEGVSRFGKAALVSMAFDTRFALALIGSSARAASTPSPELW